MSNLKFPIEGMPEFLYDFSADLADVYGVPIEFPVVSLISALGTAVGKKAKLTTPKYVNFPQLWIVIVGYSATGKSEPLKIAYNPIREFDKKQFVDFQNRMTVWNAENARAKVEGQQPPPKPTQTRIMCTDTTPEALWGLLAESPSMTVWRDEFAGIIKDIGRYSSSGEVEHWLSCFDNTSFRLDRRNTENSTFISDPILSLVGTIQPEVLNKIAGGHNMKENGFLQRCLFAYPDAVSRPYYSDKAPNQKLLEQYDRIINRLLNLPETLGFTLNEEANKMYITFANEMTDKINKTSHNYLKALYGKMEIHLLRLALILSIIDTTENDNPEKVVSAEVMQYAIDLCRYFIVTGEKMFDKNAQLPTKAEAIRAIVALYPNINRTAFARSLYISPQRVDNVLSE